MDGQLPPVIPISLAAILTPAENDQWDKSAVFLTMPRGTQSFGGIEFWLEGVVQLQCKSSKDEHRDYREKIVVPLLQTNLSETMSEIIQRGSNVASVHLLGATRYGSEGECALASMVWRYTDGSTRRTLIQFENHVRDWIRMPYESPTYLPYAFSKAVWYRPLADRPGLTVRLYRFSYANPEPAKVVRQLEFVSAMEASNLFLVGLTLDPLKLGERPDDSPNLEPTDSVPAGQLTVLVQNPESQPIPNARVRVVIQQASGMSPSYMDRSVRTDHSGVAQVNHPPVQDLQRLEISASHEDYGARKMVWDTKAGDVIPASYTLKLSGGVTIGGTVVDSNDYPVGGAQLRFSRFWSGGEEIHRLGDQADFPSQSQTTDAQGRWQAKGLPASFLDRISCNVKHPDFVETRLTVGGNAAEEARFRDGTHKLVLQGGLRVRGRVMDDQETPLPEARVWAGMMNHSGTQETKTDAQGAFTVSNLKEGEMQFSVLAKGRKPEVRKVTVKAGMDEIVFKLGAGQVIRGMVKNEADEPVPGVRVALESPMGGVAQDFRFEMTSDNAGRFEWDGAPDEPRNFCFLKTGYESKRRQPLKPGVENVITLRKCRKVRGWVVDAQTERAISKFRVGIGRYNGPGLFSPDYPGGKKYADANGMFSLELSEQDATGIKAEADDYADQIQSLPEAQNGEIEVVFRLKPSAALRGVVVTPEGKPVPGATVALTSDSASLGGRSASLKNGRLTSWGDQSKIVTTDASGQFTLPSPPETGGLVVAAAEGGYGSASVQQVRDTGGVVLQTYGRIEGTFKVGGQPVAGQEFLFSVMNSSVATDFQTYKTQTDEQGRFSFDKVPPGAGQIVRLVVSRPNSWTHSHQTDVMVEPGQTTQVALGDSGAVLQGRVRFETPPDDKDQLTLSGMLNTQMPERPQNFASPDEARAFFDSPEWKARMKQAKHFAVAIGADGAWALDSVPPGVYTLIVTASKPSTEPWSSPPLARGQTTVTVSEGASFATPIATGELVLKPIPKL